MARSKKSRNAALYSMKGFPAHATTSPLTNDDEIDYSKISANMELNEDQKLKSRELAGHKKVGGHWTRPMTEEERRSMVTAGSAGPIDAGAKLGKLIFKGGKWVYDKLSGPSDGIR